MPVRDLLTEHEHLRTSGLNLQASENAPSRAVREALAGDLAGRYAEPYYGGSGPAVRIIEEVEDLACEAFGADHALVTPLSGHMCELACLLALTDVGDAMAMVPVAEGGYPLGCELLDRERLDLPTTGHVPLADALPGFFADHDPAVTVLGASFLPFPHPVEAARAAFDGPLVYDGAHVMGLLATGAFQDPLAEGADVLIGSTHKSLPGPQGGVVLTDDPDLADQLRTYLEFDEETGIGLVDNPHPSRIAALGVALEELAGRPDYGADVVANARALAEALDERGVPVLYADRGYTASHQVLLDLAPDEVDRYCSDLEDQLIFVDRGGRVGTAEATWRGMGPEEMQTIAEMMARVFDGDADGVRKEAERLAREFQAP